MTKQQRKTIEREFYKYEWNRREATNHTVTAVAYNSSAPDGERVKTSSGNKNEQLMIRAIYETEQMLGWVKVFEKTLDKFKWEHKDKLMRKRYIERKSIWRTCEEIGISRATYFYWLEDIMQTAFMWALELKLF
ncbi:MAG: DUF1492 domain-containing protein [Clostridia bacterium]|nr:DUF1492 domain-containing protein [Clostridia bacterium]